MTGRHYAYYPGCSGHITSKEYDATTRLVWQELGIGLEEIPDWTCCGASSAHAMSKLLGYALPARNLQLVEESGLAVTTPCPACFARLKFTTHDLKNTKLREDVGRVIGHDFANNVAVLPILATMLPEEVSAAVKRPLTGLKIACYYGCAFVRPNKVTEFDDEENPATMDRLLSAAGAETIDWAFKTECCGASLTITRPHIVERLSGRILLAAKRSGVDCVAVACPVCQANLDQRQGAIARELGFGDPIGMPVVYFTQLLALALGFGPKELMLEKQTVDPRPMLRAKGLI